MEFGGLSLKRYGMVGGTVAKTNAKSESDMDFQAMLEAEQKKMESHCFDRKCDSKFHQ